MRRLSSVAAIGAGLLVLALRPAPAPRSAGSTVSGKIKFVGKAPANPTIDMSEEAKCKAKYTGAPPRDEVVVVNKNGTLANVFVYVKTGLPAGGKYPAPSTPVVQSSSGSTRRRAIVRISAMPRSSSRAAAA